MTLRPAYRYAKLVGRHGPLYPFRQSVFPRRILAARPIHTETSGDIKVCVLTSRKDWLLCLWSLVSFYEFSGRRDPLLIFSDGTLSPCQQSAILHVFPDARIIQRSWADEAMSGVLDPYPRCMLYRAAQPFAARIVDFPALCHSPFILVLDSDVLFFREPVELNAHLAARRPGSFVFLRDYQDAYFAPRHRIREEFGLDLPPAVNCGLMFADVSGFHYDWFEDWLTRPEVFSHGWSEQTLWAMYGARMDIRILGGDYVVRPGRGIPSRMVLRHYVTPVRDLMYVEGIPYLDGLLRSRGVFGAADVRLSPSALSPTL